ncbi:hypothetical protein TNCV_2468841 [Trichonephila clavipes]|nr:hypothetical protein TNCV_2468841 [Trichonephila clavipes]
MSPKSHDVQRRSPCLSLIVRLNTDATVSQVSCMRSQEPEFQGRLFPEDLLFTFRQIFDLHLVDEFMKNEDIRMMDGLAKSPDHKPVEQRFLSSCSTPPVLCISA